MKLCWNSNYGDPPIEANAIGRRCGIRWADDKREIEGVKIFYADDETQELWMFQQDQNGRMMTHFVGQERQPVIEKVKTERRFECWVGEVIFDPKEEAVFDAKDIDLVRGTGKR